MRVDGFLRTPIRGADQARLRELKVVEAPLSGNPDPTQPYPQTTDITFTLADATAPVQIAPLWEGDLVFVPDAAKGNPRVAGQVNPDSYPHWSVTGALLLRTWPGAGNLQATAFATHLPLLDPAPDVVRYDRVRLTPEFLFTTLRDAPRVPFTLAHRKVTPTDPHYASKRIIAFLAGTLSLRCLLDPTDPDKDTAAMPMPVVLAEPGAPDRFRLRIAIASTSAKSFTPGWFAPRRGLDDVAVDPIVPTALASGLNQLTNPAHPAFSVIPTRAVYSGAPAAAFATDVPVTAPLRAALTATPSDGARFRRVSLRRPPIPGLVDDVAARRLYPAHQVCWAASGSAPASLRMPLSGSIYLPLSDADYRVWVLPRSADPATTDHGQAVRLGLVTTGAKVAAMPSDAVVVPLGSNTHVTIDTHLRDYDSALADLAYRTVGDAAGLQIAAGNRWHVYARLRWLVRQHRTRSDQSILYGLFRESAARHGLSPELVEVTFFGEGGGQVLPADGSLDLEQVLDCYGFIGLDLIIYRAGQVPVGKPPVPPEAVAEGDPDEIAEYQFNLVTEGYLDAAVASRVVCSEQITRTEGAARTLQIGTVAGWAAAIEIVAAELHARIDEMTDYLTAQGRPVDPTDELARRFLGYLRYNTKPARARELADNLSTNLARWAQPWPPDNRNAHYNTLQRIAVMEWHQAAGAYRRLP